MFKFNLKIAFRDFRKYKVYTIINILGLAVGIAISILILHYVLYEIRYDRFNKKAKQIYRICHKSNIDDDKYAYTQKPLAEALLNDFPEVLSAVRLNLWSQNRLIQYQDKSFLEKGIIVADSSIFDVFTIPFILGDSKTALTKPYTIVLTENIAQKYFGKENPIGKTLKIDKQEIEYQITGIVKQMPSNSHFKFDFIISYLSDPNYKSDEWTSHCLFTYIVLPENYPYSELEAKLPDFIIKHYGPQFYEDTGINYEEYIKDDKNRYILWLQPLVDIHLFSKDIIDNLEDKGDVAYVYIFTAIAVLILIIACINFINLTTAKSLSRLKIVGIKKTLGSSRLNLTVQFLAESIIICLISLFLALIIIESIFPFYKNLINSEIEFKYFNNPFTLAILSILTLFIGGLAGIYPAIYLSSFRSVTAVKEILNSGHNSYKIRNILVVFQFFITLLVIIFTLVIYLQTKYLKNKNLGFNKENIIVIHRAYSLGSHRESFKRILLENPKVICMSNTNSLPGRHFNDDSYRHEYELSTIAHTIPTMYGDYEFANLLDLQLSKGRFFSRDLASDASAVVINEMAVRELGLKDPLGIKLIHGDQTYKIVGIVKDIHFRTLHQILQPMLIRNLVGSWGNFISVKIYFNEMKNTLKYIEKAWKEFADNEPFEYSFLDKDLDNLYKSEERTAKILTVFSIISIFIACLGILGLSYLSTQHRTKEIGIRKTNGAKMREIMLMLSKDFTKWVVIAFIIACPVAYIAINKWLQNFAYRTSISWWIFAIAGIIAYAIALLTVSWQSWRAARRNPVESLRYE